MAYTELASSAERPGQLDARLEAVLTSCSLDELRDMQALVLRSCDDHSVMKDVVARMPEVGHWIRFRGDDDDVDADTMALMLLGALALAIAWLVHRSQPAPAHRIQEALAVLGEGHTYLLAIPRSGPCFCGCARKFRHCHGQPPVAA